MFIIINIKMMSSLSKIRISIIYINNKNEIFYIKYINNILENGKLKNEDILTILKNYKYMNNKKYHLFSIQKYDITITGNLNMKQYIESILYNSNLLKKENIKNDIKFHNCFKDFESLNELFFFFKEPIINNKTRKKKI